MSERTIQSIEFDLDIWTKQKSVEWLKKNNYKYNSSPNGERCYYGSAYFIFNQIKIDEMNFETNELSYELSDHGILFVYQ